MGVLRIPRPAGVSIPTSPTRSITTDMISPPLSPDFDFDADTLIPSIMPALGYISTKLQQKSLHVSLLIGRGQPFPTGLGSDLIVIPITQLDQESWKSFYRIFEKGAKKFSLGRSWTDAISQNGQLQVTDDYLIQQSIQQNTVLFSQEGLTLLGIDRIYLFKRRLSLLSSGNTDLPPEMYLNSCVKLLRQSIIDLKGRPFSKTFFYRVYSHLNIKEDLLIEVSRAYQAKFGHEGIVLSPPRPKMNLHRKLSSGRPRVHRPAVFARQPTPPKSATHSKHHLHPNRGPRTPVSASDVTPITKEEWNILIGPEFRQNKQIVTMWVPSPVYAAA